MAAYVLIGTLWEKRHIRFGHETGIIVTFGILFGWLITKINPVKYELSEAMLFKFCLPLILFAEGYNMH